MSAGQEAVHVHCHDTRRNTTLPMNFGGKQVSCNVHSASNQHHHIHPDVIPDTKVATATQANANWPAKWKAWVIHMGAP